ncbi:MAG: serine hydrolase [Longimicrobiales bacterium]
MLLATLRTSLVLLLLAAQTSQAQAQRPLERLRRDLEARMARHRGVLGLAVIDLRSGDTLTIRGHERFPTASVIKLPILVELFHQMRHGRLRWEDRLVMLDADRVPGAGIIQHFQPPHELTVGDAATLMVSLSDNTATNLIIDKLGIRGVNARMDSLGLPATELYAKVFLRARTSVDTAGSARWGLGVTTPFEMATLLARLYRAELVSDTASKRMIELLKLQQTRDRIPRLLPPGTVVAHKTGEVAESRNDCGIVYAAQHEFVFCAFTRENVDQRWTLENEAALLIAQLARLVYDALAAGS